MNKPDISGREWLKAIAIIFDNMYLLVHSKPGEGGAYHIKHLGAVSAAIAADTA